jgi:hypothetical protein
VSPEELHGELVELARAAGFEVRRASGRAGADSDLPIASGVCRVRGVIWVVLNSTESLDERNEVLASALRSHAGSMLEGRYLAPALRARVGR